MYGHRHAALDRLTPLPPSPLGCACGLTYDMDSLDVNQCPTKYSMKTYNSEEEMLAAGAEMTHWGAVSIDRCSEYICI